MRDIKRRDTRNYLFCTGGQDGFVLWNLDPYTGEFEVIKIAGDARASVLRVITALSFSPDKETIFGSSSSGDFLMVNVKHQRIVGTVAATRAGIGALLSFEGGVIIGCGDATIKFFDGSNTFIGFTKLDAAVNSLSFSPDKLEVLAGTVCGTIVRVNIANRQFITISESHTSTIVATAFALGSNDRFATASLDGTIRVWDIAEYAVIATARSRREQAGDVTPQCLQFADVLLSGWSDGRVLAHSGETGDNLWFIDNAHPGGLTSLVLSHNRRFILTGGSAGEVRLWELRSRDLISHLKEHVNKVTALALFEDDTLAVSASRDRCLLRWDLTTERRVFCHAQRMGGINSVIISKDQSCIVSVGQEKKITFWPIGSPEPLFSHNLEGESEEGRCIARSNSGDLIAVGTTSGVLRVFEYHSKRQISDLRHHSATITGVCFSADDRQVVSVGEDGSIVIWCIF